jgi:hypothetical protein
VEACFSQEKKEKLALHMFEVTLILDTQSYISVLLCLKAREDSDSAEQVCSEGTWIKNILGPTSDTY